MNLAVSPVSSMIQCQNCGKSNTDESQFCRFCGNRMAVRQAESYDFHPPRPYAWKTDEYQTKSDVRARRPTEPIQQHHPPAQYGQTGAVVNVTAYRGPQDLAGNYRCPFCGTNYLPVIERRISTIGWVTFGILLVMTLVFFWIGLLIKEEVAICPVCRRQVS